MRSWSTRSDWRLEAIRFYADEFPFWQRHQQTGRPPTEERTLLAAFLVRQLFDATFRETEGLLTLLSEYFHMERVPDHTTMIRKNASQRWLALWKRFHDFVMSSLRKRAPVIATDASGFSGRKRSWRETDHGLKATQDWIKIHAAIEVDQFFVLSYCLTESNVHDSQMFPEVWDNLLATSRRSGVWRTPLTSATTAWRRPGSMERCRYTASRRMPDISRNLRRGTRKWSHSGSTGRTGPQPCTASATMLKRRSA